MGRPRNNDLVERMISAALDLSEADHYQRVTRRAIATRAGAVESLVSYYLGGIDEIRERIILAAIKQRRLAVIAQGLAAGDETAQGVPQSLKRAALETLI